MKKFTIKIAFLIIAFASVVIILELLFSNYNNFVSDKFEDFYTSRNNVEVILIGNSHMQSIGAPKIDSKDSFNFSFGGQDIFHMYSILETILNKPNNIKSIYIALDYDLLGYDYKIANTMWLDRLYYKDTKTLYDKSLANFLMANLNFFKANRRVSNIKSQKESGFTEESNKNFIVANSSCVDRAIEHSISKFDENLVQKNAGYLKKIIQLCEKSNIELILINLPKTDCYCDNYNSKTVTTSLLAINKIVTEHNVKFIDLWQDSLFNDTMFHDSDHFNSKYNHILLNKIKKELE